MKTELTTHEMLKSICDKIGYEIPEDYIYVTKEVEDDILGNPFDQEDLEYNYFAFKQPVYEEGCMGYFQEISVREIIFTQEFIDKFKKYYFDRFAKCNLSKEIKFFAILDHLDNPTQYLFDLIN